MNNPLVSIVVPSYNHEKYVEETLDSVRNQTYDNMEIIIIDDHSEDSSVLKIESWLHKHKPNNCVFIKHSVNKGLVFGLNESILLAKGKYWCGCASDDICLPNRIEESVAILESLSGKFGAVYSDAYLIKMDGSERYGRFIQKCRDFEDIPEGDIFNDLVIGNFIPAMTTLIKKAVFDEIGHFDEKMAIEDWDMWLRIAKRYHFAYSRNIFGKYRIHDKNTVHSLVKHYQEIRYRTLVKHATDNAEVRKQVLDIARGMYYTSDPAAKEVLKDFRERFGIVSMEYLLSKYHIPHSVPTLFIVIWRKLCHKRP